MELGRQPRLAWLAWICAARPWRSRQSIILDLTAHQRVVGWDGVYTLRSRPWPARVRLSIARSNSGGGANRRPHGSPRASAAWWVSEVAWFYREIVGEQLGPSSLAGQSRLHPAGAADRHRPRALHPARQSAVVQQSAPALVIPGIITAMLTIVISLPVNDALSGSRHGNPRRRSSSILVLCALLVVFQPLPPARLRPGARRRIRHGPLLLGISCIVGAKTSCYTFAALNPAFDLGDILDPAWATGFVLDLRSPRRRALPAASKAPGLDQWKRSASASAGCARRLPAFALWSHDRHRDREDMADLSRNGGGADTSPAVLLKTARPQRDGVVEPRQLPGPAGPATQPPSSACTIRRRASGAVLEFSPDPDAGDRRGSRIRAAGRRRGACFGQRLVDLLGQRRYRGPVRGLSTTWRPPNGSSDVDRHQRCRASLASHRLNATGLRQSGEQAADRWPDPPLNGGAEHPFAVALRDITERITVEHELRTAKRDGPSFADRAKSEFLANMASHASCRTTLSRQSPAFAEIIEA